MPVKWAAPLTGNMLHEDFVFVIQDGVKQYVWKVSLAFPHSASIFHYTHVQGSKLLAVLEILFS